MISHASKHPGAYARIGDETLCVRCGAAIKRDAVEDFTRLAQGKTVGRELCGLCEQRDHFIFLHVRKCIHLYRGCITLDEMMELYHDEDDGLNLHFDPFQGVRMRYHGKEGLEMSDISRWFRKGLLANTVEGRLLLRGETFIPWRRKDKNDPDSPAADSNGKRARTKRRRVYSRDSVSRLRDNGGASTGRHRLERIKQV